ncbi:hypothetical protein [Nonomuraea sp. NPDC050786]|uniref:hypothetical protein n=1 Tax=Nonomuraea sp. NPDC050786 TaxID=3154840 RepID=UPI0033BFEA12
MIVLLRRHRHERRVAVRARAEGDLPAGDVLGGKQVQADETLQGKLEAGFFGTRPEHPDGAPAGCRR